MVHHHTPGRPAHHHRSPDNPMVHHHTPGRPAPSVTWPTCPRGGIVPPCFSLRSLAVSGSPRLHRSHQAAPAHHQLRNALPTHRSTRTPPPRPHPHHCEVP